VDSVRNRLLIMTAARLPTLGRIRYVMLDENKLPAP
jgi:hypothetical protein